MENGFEYETAIVDHMSGPAAKESEALEHLAGAALKAEDSIHKLSQTHEVAGKKHHESAGMFEEFGKSLIPQIALGELAAEGIKKVGESVIETAHELGELTIEGMRFALEMREFKDDAILAYSVIQGTAEEGERTFAEIDRLGRAVHMPVERAHDVAQRLMEQGLENVHEVENVIQAVSDLQRTGNERGAEKFQSIIERSLASGAFQPKAKMLAGTGVQMTALLGELATELHRPVTEIQAELKAGRIGAEQGIVALENVFAHSKIHEIAAKNFNLTDITTDIKNSVRGLFQDVDTEPLMHALFNMSYAFGEASKEGGGLKGTVTDLFNWIIRGVSPVIDGITELGLEFEIGFLKARIASKPLTDELARMGFHVADMDSLGASAEALGYGLTRAVIAITWLVAKLEKLREMSEPAKAGGHEIGTGLVEGMINSITLGGYGVTKAVHGLVAAALDKARDVAGIHSPSTETYEMGGQLTQGMALGIDAGAHDVARAMGDSADPGAFGRSGGEGGGSRTVNVHPGAIAVEIHAPQAGATKEEIQEIAESAMEDVVERLVLELGG